MTLMADHCLALLSWAAKPENRGKQDSRAIAQACGIPRHTLSAILTYHRHHGDRACYLCQTARNHRFIFKVFPPGHGSVIDAVHMGYIIEGHDEIESMEGNDYK